MSDNEEDNIRNPLPIINSKLIDEFNIKNDDTIDNDTRNAIIVSRTEYLNNYKNKLNIDKIKITVSLIKKIKDYDITKISEDNKTYIIEQIEKWINEEIEIIELDPILTYEIFILIDLINYENEYKEYDLKNIFFPNNYDEYLEYVDMMEIIKNISILEEQEKIKKEQIEKENEEKNKLKIEQNELKLSILNLNLNRLSCFDSKIKSLRINLEIPIKKFVNLETDYINIDSELNKKLINFLNSIRIADEDKEKILNLYR